MYKKEEFIDNNKADKERLVKYEMLIDKVVANLVNAPKIVDGPVHHAAGQITDSPEDTLAIRKKIIESIPAGPNFRQRVSAEILKELSGESVEDSSHQTTS